MSGEREGSYRTEVIKHTNKLSLLCASFNQAHYLNDLLHSLKSQTFQDFELVVVDNFSSDSSVEKFRAFDKVKLVQLATNADEAYWAAFRLCSGQYVMSVSTSDFLFSVDWLDRGIKALDSDVNISLVYSSSVVVNEYSEFESINGLGNLIFHPPSQREYFSLWLMRHYLPELNFIIRRNVLEALLARVKEQYNPPRFHSWIPYLFTRHGYLLKFIPDIAHAGRKHRGQLTEVDNTEKLIASRIRQYKLRYMISLLRGTLVHTIYDGNGNQHSQLNRMDICYVLLRGVQVLLTLASLKVLLSLAHRLGTRR